MARSSRQSGQRSRAARRAVSPSLNLDRSLKNVKPPAESVDHRPSILSIHYGAGVTKKNKKRADLSHKKRKRLEKGMARAEFAMDKLELKVAKSIGRGKTIKGRKATWDELNSSIPAVPSTPLSRKELEQELDSKLAEVQPVVAESTPPEAITEQKDITSELQKVGALSLTAKEGKEEEEIL